MRHCDAMMSNALFWRMNMSTLFEKIGGEAAVDAAVDQFYIKVLADNRINHFFNDVDMIKQRGHQKRFLTFAFGGAPSYSGKSMLSAHKKLVEEKGLSDVHFDAVIEHLVSTLTDLGVSEDLICDVAKIGESTRKDILNQ